MSDIVKGVAILCAGVATCIAVAADPPLAICCVPLFLGLCIVIMTY